MRVWSLSQFLQLKTTKGIVNFPTGNNATSLQVTPPQVNQTVN